MDDVTRRSLLRGGTVSLAAGGLGQDAIARTAAFGPDDPYDLVVRGGEVLDPSQNLRGRRDIGIHNAAIVALESEIPASRGRQTLDVKGQLVLPGLIDFHAHMYPGSDIGLSGVPLTGTTTYVSAGDSGVSGFAVFKHLGIPKISHAYIRLPAHIINRVVWCIDGRRNAQHRLRARPCRSEGVGREPRCAVG